MLVMTSIFRRLLPVALLACSQLPGEIRTLTILHTNDLHARISPIENGNGGFAYVASVIRREKAGCKDCILLNAGDLAQGSPVSTIFHGLPVFEIANLLGFDAATLGNHDFDYGWMQAKKFVQTAKYPIVTANMLDPSGKLITGKPYVILHVNGLRIGVLGAMTDDLPHLTTANLIAGCRILPMLDTVRQYAKELY